jgi:CRP/FNR family transcriptional regulator
MVEKEKLNGQILFEDIPETHLDYLSSVVNEISMKTGEVLFSDGDETKGIYLIHSGKIEITKVTSDGWKQTLAVFSKGHFFGELSIMEKRHHEATATAFEDSNILLLSVEDFERLEKDNMEMAYLITKNIAVVMSKNLRRMNNKFLQALINY